MNAQQLKRLGLLALGVTFCLAALNSGCAPAVAVFRTTAPAGPAQAPGSVKVYMDEVSAPRGYQELGLIIVNTHVFIPVNFNLDTQLALAAQMVRKGNARDTRVFGDLVRKAARLGADALIIKSFTKVGVNLSISAVAIRTRCFRQPRCVPACPPGTVPASAPAPPTDLPPAPLP